jgi:hypothetical protein
VIVIDKQVVSGHPIDIFLIPFLNEAIERVPRGSRMGKECICDGKE